jgi:hypothetical protein
VDVGFGIVTGQAASHPQTLRAHRLLSAKIHVQVDVTAARYGEFSFRRDNQRENTSERFARPDLRSVCWLNRNSKRAGPCTSFAITC